MMGCGRFVCMFVLLYMFDVCVCVCVCVFNRFCLVKYHWSRR